MLRSLSGRGESEGFPFSQWGLRHEGLWEKGLGDEGYWADVRAAFHCIAAPISIRVKVMRKMPW